MAKSLHACVPPLLRVILRTTHHVCLDIRRAGHDVSLQTKNREEETGATGGEVRGVTDLPGHSVHDRAEIDEDRW